MTHATDKACSWWTNSQCAVYVQQTCVKIFHVYVIEFDGFRQVGCFFFAKKAHCEVLQEIAPAADFSPLGHGVHLLDPGLEKVFSGHITSVVLH